MKKKYEDLRKLVSDHADQKREIMARYENDLESSREKAATASAIMADAIKANDEK